METLVVPVATVSPADEDSSPVDDDSSPAVTSVFESPVSVSPSVKTGLPPPLSIISPVDTSSIGTIR